MRLNDFLDVLRAEFDAAADDIDAGLMAWLESDPAAPQEAGEPVVATLGRLATVARMVGLEGQAVAVEQLRDAAQLAGLGDDSERAAALGWLVAWRMAVAPVFAQPGDAGAAAGLVDYFRHAPSPLPEPLLDSLHAWLCRAPVLPQDDEDTRRAAFPDPQPVDVALEVPADVDHELFESFLAQAPDQLAVLGEAVRLLAEHSCPPDALAEAQRVAHTFKGSGNIIGIRGVGRLAHRVEDVLDFAQAQSGRLPAAMAHDLLLATATLEQMVYALRGEETPPANALDQLQCLTDWARAIDDGTWRDRAAAADAGDALERSAARSDAPDIDAPTHAASRTEAPPAAEPAAQLRVDATRLETLTRRAGQQLVQQARVADRLQRLEQRLVALLDSQRALDQRLAELQAQIDRQGVSLHSRADEAGQGFDALEMDRYNELHSLARLAAEMVADGLDLSRSAHGDARELAGLVIEQEQSLKLQHAQLQATRLVPFRQIVSRLQRNVSQTAAATGKRARLLVEGDDTMVDATVLEQLTEPLLHLLRNAVDHGIETPALRAGIGKPEQGTVRLQVEHAGQQLRVICQDDGRGLDLPAIHAKALSLGLVAPDREPDPQDVARMILLPGFSTRETVSDISGRGLGMDVVAQRVRTLKGRLDIASEPFEGTRFTLELAANSGTAHVLVVQAGGEVFALPTTAVVAAWPAVALRCADGQLVTDTGRWTGRSLAWAVGLSPTSAPDGGRPAVVLHCGREDIAFEVDAVLETRELVLQDIGRLLRALPGIGAGAIRANGRVVTLLDPESLVDARTRLEAGARRVLRERARQAQRRALVVDDSHTVRKLLAQVLGDAGWAVSGARDGFDALAQLAARPFDIVLTDLEMPNLNGLELTRQIRALPQGGHLPVLMITSRDTDKHRRNALQAGVDRYLTKPHTDEDLLANVRELMSASNPAPASAAAPVAPAATPTV